MTSLDSAQLKFKAQANIFPHGEDLFYFYDSESEDESHMELTDDSLGFWILNKQTKIHVVETRKSVLKTFSEIREGNLPGIKFAGAFGTPGLVEIHFIPETDSINISIYDIDGSKHPKYSLLFYTLLDVLSIGDRGKLPVFGNPKEMLFEEVRVTTKGTAVFSGRLNKFNL